MGSWLRICLIETKDRMVLTVPKRIQAFRGIGKVTLIYLVPDYKCVRWLSSKKNVTLCLAMTARPVSEPKYWILRSCLQELTKRASAVD